MHVLLDIYKYYVLLKQCGPKNGDLFTVEGLRSLSSNSNLHHALVSHQSRIKISDARWPPRAILSNNGTLCITLYSK